MLIRRFAVSGYRSFEDVLELRDLGQFVVLFGRNNAGKSNLLRALDLFHRLAALPLVRLVDGSARFADTFYREFGQDAWMFHQPDGTEVTLNADLADTASDATFVTIGFTIRRDADGIKMTLTQWSIPQLGDQAEEARFVFHLLGGLQDQYDDVSIDAQKAAWDDISDRWKRQQPAVGSGMAIFRAGDFDTDARRARVALWEAATSTDLDRRKRAAWALARFGELVPGLPPGRLEPTFGAAAVAREPAPEAELPGDLAWVADTVILPLDQLGAGAQVVCGVLATLALQPATWIALEEPESHLHGQLQRELAGLIADAIVAPSPLLPPRQVFIATHAAAFAEAKFDIRLLQHDSGHDGGQTSVQTLSPEAAVGFAAVANGDPQRQRTPSLLNYDGTIRLPDFVLEKYADSKGQFLYFVDDDAGGFKLMTEVEMDAYLGDGEP